jgi:hypothetical protein
LGYPALLILLECCTTLYCYFIILATLFHCILNL